MSARMIAAAVMLLAGVSVSADTQAPIPREASFVGTNVLSGSVKVLPLGKERLQITYEVTGVSLGDASATDIFRNASMRCMGGLHALNGSFDDESGSCSYIVPDGDQIFMTYKAKGKVGIEAQGVSTIIGGTGKLAGIEGRAEWTRTNVRPAADGTTQSIIRTKGTYKLPAAPPTRPAG